MPYVRTLFILLAAAVAAKAEETGTLARLLPAGTALSRRATSRSGRAGCS
jgi:hypothetical protein